MLQIPASEEKFLFMLPHANLLPRDVPHCLSFRQGYRETTLKFILLVDGELTALAEKEKEVILVNQEKIRVPCFSFEELSHMNSQQIATMLYIAQYHLNLEKGWTKKYILYTVCLEKRFCHYDWTSTWSSLYLCSWKYICVILISYIFLRKHFFTCWYIYYSMITNDCAEPHGIGSEIGVQKIN